MSQKNAKYNLCIIGGGGHVGLPLGVAFACSGLKTVILDINLETLEKISSGIFPFKEDNGEERLKEALETGNIYCSSSPEVIAESEMVICIVGTPIDEYLNPDFKAITKVVDDYFDHFFDGQIFILRSTVYPQTTEKIRDIFQKRGKNVRMAYCPERIAEGKAFAEFENLPQIVSAFDQETLSEVTQFFSRITKQEIIRLRPLEAELSKLFTNAWRYITFAISNQFYMMAENLNADFSSIYRAITKDYPRTKGMPSPGFAAGPCLLKDTMQLAAYSNNTFSLGQAAMLINEGMPKFIIDHIKQAVVRNNPNAVFNKLNIGVLGMAFKANSDDSRDSLSYKLKKIAKFEFNKVLCHDPLVEDDTLVDLNTLLNESDIIVLASPHNEYKEIDKQKYPNKTFIDIWNFL